MARLGRSEMKAAARRVTKYWIAVLIAGLASALFASGARAQPARPPEGCVGTASDTWLFVSVENVRSGNGLIAFTLYADDRSRFLVKRGSLAVMRVPAQQGTTRACIFLPKPGTYAVAVYHDENGDQGFDRSGLGFPVEGFGFTNNPATLAGLPSFNSVRLSVPRTGLLTRIRLKYP